MKQFERGVPIEQETRSWNGENTCVMRKKEGEYDYLFIPEYDIPIIENKFESLYNINIHCDTWNIIFDNLHLLCEERKNRLITILRKRNIKNIYNNINKEHLIDMIDILYEINNKNIKIIDQKAIDLINNQDIKEKRIELTKLVI